MPDDPPVGINESLPLRSPAVSIITSRPSVPPGRNRRPSPTHPRHPGVARMSLRYLAPLALAAFVALPVAAQETDDPAAAGAPIESPDAETADPKVPLDEIRRYVSVYNAVKQAYVEPVEDRKLMHSAIRGLLFDLDPHSVYLD